MQLAPDLIPIYYFRPEIECCPWCGKKLKVLKTGVKTVYSEKYGIFIAHETILFCEQHKYLADGRTIRKIRPSKLRKIVKERYNYGYDITAYIGRQRFIKYRTIEEVIEKLRKKGIKISKSEVSYQSKRFLVLLKCLHDSNDEKILALIEKQGGFILHIDSTSAEDSDHTFAALDGISGIVFLSTKIRSENQNEIATILKEIKERFGEPLLILKDMAKGVENACWEVFPNTEIVECHFHFCRDVGTHLFEPYYNELKEIIKQSKIKTELKRLLKDIRSVANEKGYRIKTILKAIGADDEEWIEYEKMCIALIYDRIKTILKHKRDRSGLGVPFDLPILDLYRNCMDSAFWVEYLIKTCTRTTKPNKLLIRLDRILKKITNMSLYKARRLLQLKYKIGDVNKLFNELRTILRIKPTSGSPLSDPLPLPRIEQRTMIDELRCYKDRLEDELGKKDCALRREKQIIFVHLERHIDKLELPIIEVWNDDGVRLIVVHRTNNLIEHHFRFVKRSRRKAHGRSDVGRDLNEYGPYLSYVENLTNERYFKLMFGSWDGLIRAFSTVSDADYKIEELRFEEMREIQNWSLYNKGDPDFIIERGIEKIDNQNCIAAHVNSQVLGHVSAATVN